MKRTENGRVTDKFLAVLKADSTRWPKPWNMGISSHVLAALVTEVEEARADKRIADEHRLVGEFGQRVCSCGWKPGLGEYVMRAFDKHLLETRNGENHESQEESGQ
jgi:hypothetical protein